MANLSQIKRERMISFLEKLKESHNDDESLIALNQIERELTTKKYGLVWEEHEETVDIMMRSNIPVFSEVNSLELDCGESGSQYNFLLEGDNLHSLKLLEKTHKGTVDVIYIDPPYNTGNKDDFIYDDKMVDKTDTFKHSKWISFMKERLLIAKRILSDDGVVFISIDDNEFFQLKLLCDEIFGDNNFVAVFPRLATKSGKTPVAYMISHDYVLCYTNGREDVFVGEAFEDDSYKYSDEFVEERGRYNLKQPLDCNSISYSASLDYPIEHDGITYYPGSDIEAYKKRKAGDHLQKDYAWRWSKDLYEFGLKKGWIVFQNGRIYTKGYLNAIIEKNKDTGEYYISYREKTRKISTIDFIKNAYSNDIAKKQLSACKIDDRFEYPKPIELIKKLISTYYKKDAVVVDFFAGSGTTAQAVLELNQSDGGHRKFILCTNNENGICENITYNRIKTVITGKVADGSLYSREIMTLIFEKELKASDLKNNSILETIDELKRENSDQYDSFSIEFEDGYIQLFGRKKESYTGIPANLMYYKTDYVSKSSDELTDELLAHIVEMIQLEYGVKVDNKRYVLILDDDAMDDFERDFHKYDNLQAVFISQNVLLTTNQEKIIKDINAFTVPDYYFDLELREAGETW